MKSILSTLALVLSLSAFAGPKEDLVKIRAEIKAVQTQSKTIRGEMKDKRAKVQLIKAGERLQKARQTLLDLQAKNKTLDQAI